MLTDQFQTLILHGDEAWRDELSATLTRRGVQCVSAGNLRDFALAHASCDVSSVVLLVTHCDEETVTRMINELRRHLPNSAIIVLLPSGNTIVTRAAFRAGAWDCLEESAGASQIVACVADATRKRPTSIETGPEDHPSRRDLQKFTIEDASCWVERLHRHLRSTYVESTIALVAAVEAKYPCTRAHSLTVAGYSETIARRMRLPVRMVENLRAAALLHDVGKIGVPDAILTKPGPLTNEEFNVIKRHPETALEILSHVSFLTDERPLILHHHERYDGKGYPTGLVGRFIPIGARILAVADALDTMFSARTYKQPYSIGQVRAELQAGAGRQFDPAVIDVALEWLAEAPDDFSEPRCVRDAPYACLTTDESPVPSRLRR